MKAEPLPPLITAVRGVDGVLPPPVRPPPAPVPFEPNAPKLPATKDEPLALDGVDDRLLPPPPLPAEVSLEDGLRFRESEPRCVKELRGDEPTLLESPWPVTQKNDN